MGTLQTKTTNCDYNKYDRQITEQFIHGLDDEGMINKILREVLALADTTDVTSEWLLLLAQRVQAKWAQKGLHKMTAARALTQLDNYTKALQCGT